mgnify:CR=1 FL=1
MLPPLISPEVAGRRILLVQDDGELRGKLCEHLQTEGYDVVPLSSVNGSDGTIDISRNSLIIIDLSITSENGFALVVYFSSTFRIPIIVLSESGSYDEKLLAYSLGVDYYMLKPIDYRILSVIVRNRSIRNNSLQSDPANEQCDVSGVSPTCINVSYEKNYRADGRRHENWQLLHNGWQLVSPDGSSIKLTIKEFQILLLLGKSKTQLAVTRKDILEVLGYQDDYYGRRALEATVYRLRKKMKYLGDSPIQTAHGIGYCLTTPIVSVF